MTKDSFIREALADVQSLKSDIMAALGNSTSDMFLKASFVAGCDSIDENLKRALVS
ncbi:hypothetical protein PBI_GAIA_75 [Mycobacterium phage Gaia]|uniref:Uncharacterized protein n=1 Tax=Mycobacterium phage Gaia TaxID=1486472 RepID=A0A068F2G5_9CAUD|nr:hypothetical protein VC46_gp158 [Mycobacterium phage Gaia]AID58894.1 hypothetical protein PBI_GAIA_75 [Mycobacterium phage Gaia]AYR00013.1 hypothetical protein PBI_NEBKISS_74 [Mycobacterium phage Nebkiss]